MRGRGICNLHLEMRQNELGHYAAFTRFACLNTEGFANSNPITTMMEHNLANTNRPSAILTGTVEKGAIHFHADKNVGADRQGCAITDLTITHCGTNQLVAEWKETHCQGGNLILQKVPQ